MTKGASFATSLFTSTFHYLRTMLFGVYLLIRKRAVLRYICRLLAVYVSLLTPKGQANIGVLYQILSLISSRF